MPTAPYFGWWVVLACGLVATCSWGFGFYGLAVYMDGLHRAHGWSTALLSLAVTVYYLAGAAALVVVGALFQRLGPAVMMAGGAVAMGAALVAVGRVRAPWQLFAAYLVMAVGWACLSSTGISATLLPWFRRRRGMAVTLALTGASVGGMVCVPLLVWIASRHGFAAATTSAGVLLTAIVLTLVALVIRRPAPLGADDAADGQPGPGRDAGRLWARREALRTARFWTLALPFALALAAQVGFIVHQVVFLRPRLGEIETALAVSVTTVAALAGRLGAAGLADLVDRRRMSAAVFAVQAAGFGVLALAGSPAALYVGCAAFGLGVGNVITLPPLLASDEFGVRSFGPVFGLVGGGIQLGVALGPTLVALLRDALGGYVGALWALLALDAAAAVIVLAGRPGAPAPRRPAG